MAIVMVTDMQTDIHTDTQTDTPRVVTTAFKLKFNRLFTLQTVRSAFSETPRKRVC